MSGHSSKPQRLLVPGPASKDFPNSRSQARLPLGGNSLQRSMGFPHLGHGGRYPPSRVCLAQGPDVMRYFFHLEDGTCIRDPKGSEFQNDTAAMVEAASVAHELSKLQVHAYEWRVVVKNEGGLRIGSVPLVPRGVPVPLH